jgi:hypothetical protein
MTMHTNAPAPGASSTDAESDATDDEEETVPDRAKPLAAYLDRRLREEGAFYDKSRFIAEEVDLSPKEIGAYLSRLQEAAPDLDIEKWGYTNGTTWRISRP